jgi:phosphoglycolate phosphatase-like HAD superfamily hydrolase
VTVKPQTKPQIQAVLFDLDDTLLDSLKARVHALERVFSENRIALNAHDFIFGLNGSPFREALKELERNYNIGEDLFNQYRRAYWFNSQDALALYPGVKEMLVKLKAEGYLLSIVTSKMHDTVFEGCRIGCAGELEKMGIADLFLKVIGLENVQKPKPDPECIRLALSGTDIDSGNTLVVGDTAADIAAAKAAGCVSCRAVWGITESEVEPLKIPADYTANNPADILRFVAQSRTL